MNEVIYICMSVSIYTHIAALRKIHLGQLRTFIFPDRQFDSKLELENQKKIFRKKIRHIFH